MGSLRFQFTGLKVFWHGLQALIKRIPQACFQEVIKFTMEKDEACIGPGSRNQNFSWGQGGLPFMCKSER